VAKFEILMGLPTYGNWPEWFPADAVGRVGLVVRFSPENHPEWVGNFRGGLSSYENVSDHPNGRDVVVISYGAVYIIDPNTRKLTNSFGGQIEYFIRVPEHSLLVFGNGLWFDAIGPKGHRWRTPRISLDGMQRLRRKGNWLFGEAFHPTLGNPNWVSFKVDLASGECSGGAFGEIATL
jgi:hypothetical protein